MYKHKLPEEEAKLIKKKLLDKARSQGIKVVEDEATNTATYVGSKGGRIVRNTLAGLKKKIRKYGNSKQLSDLTECIENIKLKLPSSKMLDNLGKDAIIIGKRGMLSDADVLSHELGHAQYLHKGRSKSLVGKTAHKLTMVSKLATTKAGSSLSAIQGFNSGVKAEKLKKEGKKESTWNKVKSVAIPAAAVAPLLISEGKASANGLKTMKELGASKELLNQSRKRLAAAWGTYAADSATPIIAGEAGRVTGRVYQRIKNKKSDKINNK